jgi:hypothetical protein
MRVGRREKVVPNGREFQSTSGGDSGCLTPQEVEVLVDLITTGPLSDEAPVEALILARRYDEIG